MKNILKFMAISSFILFSFSIAYKEIIKEESNIKENRQLKTNKKFFDNKYQEKFKDILLVINFNHPYYGNIQFLKELYSPIFKNIVFYGEKKHPEVIDVYSRNGFLLSNLLRDVLEKFPQYKGYLVVQDDCVINFWNFLDFDQEKLWFSTEYRNLKEEVQRLNLWSINLLDLDNNDWWKRGYNRTSTGKEIKVAYSNLTNKFLENIITNIGYKNVAASLCDLFYIPNKFSLEIINLSYIFQNCFCEAAIPTMFCCLDKIENWEKPSMIWSFEKQLNIDSNCCYPRKYHWIHPLKFSNQRNRDFIMTIFEEELKN